MRRSSGGCTHAAPPHKTLQPLRTQTLQVLRSALDLRESERKSARCDCTLRLRVLSARSECALRHTLAARVRAALRVRNAANVALRERACLWPLEWHVSCCHNCNVDG